MLTGKILVVDDEPSICFFLEETLTRDGHEVVVAGSGQEALKLLAEHPFDLALLDLRLGDMDGIDLLTQLRQQYPHIVVIILTAHATLETAVEALRQGAHDYLFKPSKTVQLRESVRTGLLNRRRERQQRNILHQLEQQLASGLQNIRATMDEKVETVSLVDELYPAKPPVEQGRFAKLGELLVDFSRHVITLEGHLLELSPTEFDLLAYLISEAPRVVSPQELVREVQGYSSEVWEARDTVRQHIYNIRQKIKEVSPEADIIRTVRGVGYTINY